MNDLLFYTASGTNSSCELWVSNGAGPGPDPFWMSERTEPSGISPGREPSLFFGGPNEGGYGLWISDGTHAGTVVVEQLASVSETRGS